MDESHRLPPNTLHYYMEQRLAVARRSGHKLRFVVTPRDRTGFELSALCLNERGEPERFWLTFDHDREKLEQIRQALEAQEPSSTG